MNERPTQTYKKRVLSMFSGAYCKKLVFCKGSYQYRVYNFKQGVNGQANTHELIGIGKNPINAWKETLSWIMEDMVKTLES